jgi:hypothetical protein
MTLYIDERHPVIFSFEKTREFPFVVVDELMEDFVRVLEMVKYGNKIKSEEILYY